MGDTTTTRALTGPIQTIGDDHVDVVPHRVKRKKWQPVRWTSKHNLICQLFAAGQKEAEVAREVKLSQQMIHLVVTSDRGKEVVAEMMERFKEDFERRVRGKVVTVSEVALRRASDYLESEEHAKAFPLEMFDSAIKFLDRTQMLRMRDSEPEVNVESNTVNIQNAVMIPKEQIAGLIEGLSKADKVRAIPPRVEAK
jgi:hypothetical protein